MKKMFFVCVTILFMGISARTGMACHVYFDPEKFEQPQTVGTIVTVTAIVEKEHRNCPLKDNDVTVTLSEQAEIVKESGWEAQGRKNIVNTFEIKILQAGTITLHVQRECQKKGISEASLEFIAE